MHQLGVEPADRRVAGIKCLFIIDVEGKFAGNAPGQAEAGDILVCLFFRPGGLVIHPAVVQVAVQPPLEEIPGIAAPVVATALEAGFQGIDREGQIPLHDRQAAVGDVAVDILGGVDIALLEAPAGIGAQGHAFEDPVVGADPETLAGLFIDQLVDVVLERLEEDHILPVVIGDRGTQGPGEPVPQRGEEVGHRQGIADLLIHFLVEVHLAGGEDIQVGQQVVGMLEIDESPVDGSPVVLFDEGQGILLAAARGLRGKTKIGPGLEHGRIDAIVLEVGA